MVVTSINIKALRTAKDWNQGQLAELLQVRRHCISRWETGAVTPSKKHIDALCRIFEIQECSLHYLPVSNQVLTTATIRLLALPEPYQSEAFDFINKLWEALPDDLKKLLPHQKAPDDLKGSS